MKKSNKKRNISFYFIVFGILLMFMTIGYAALSRTLTIIGNTKIEKNSWVIYFDDVEVANDSVKNVDTSKDARIVNREKTNIEFTANLQNPGDFYEFTVYTVNDGSIDAAVSSIEKSELTEEQLKYLTYEVKYDDGEEIKRCDILRAKTRRLVKAVVKFKDNLEIEDYPTETINLKLNFTINYEQNVSCEQEESTKHILTIDSKGGVYEGRTDPRRIYLDNGDEYTLSTPTRFLYNFKEWKITSPEEGTYTFEDGKFTMGDENVTIEAVWIEGEYVARIMNVYYKSVQEAFDAAASDDWEDNTVYLVRNVTESPTNNTSKPFKFDLAGKTLTGNIVNSKVGDIQLVNGTVKAGDNDAEAFTNYGILKLGENDGQVYTENTVKIIGNNVGLRNIKIGDNVGEFYFYDGYIEGVAGIVGGYTDKEDKFYVFAEHITDRDIQRVYLIRNPNRAVAKTTTEGEMFYYNLQDAFNTAAQNKLLNPYLTNDDYIVYGIREFEAAYEMEIATGYDVIFDLVGNDISFGANLVNNGTLRITNSDEKNTKIRISESINNNSNLIIDNLSLEATTDKNVVNNSGNLTLTNSTIQSKNGYGVNNTEGGTISLDENSNLTSTNKYGLNNSSSTFEITNGNIYGFNNTGTASIKENVKIHNAPNSYAVNNSGTVNVDGGRITDTSDTVLVNNTGTFNVNAGVLSSKTTSISGGKIVTNGGTISTTNGPTINSLDVTVNGGTITSDEGRAIYSQGKIEYNNGIKYYPGKVTVNGGTIEGNNNAIYSNYITINDGNISATGTAVQDYTVTYTYSGNKYYINGYTTVNGGTIDGDTNGVISDKFTMTDGTITSSSGNGVVNNKTGVISGGSVSGNNYGVLNSGVLTIGEDDENIDSTEPVILGDFYGVYNDGTEVNFYDGILKGATASHYGRITGTPTGSIVFTGEEEIGGETYETEFVSSYENWLRVGSEEFNNINDASKAIDTEGTIEVIKNADITFKQTFLDEDKNKNITFDFNGFTVTSTQSIFNESNVTIVDSSQDKTGGIISTRVAGLTNKKNHTLTINGGNYNSTATYAIDNQGTMVIENADITSNTGILNSSSLTVNNINIHDTSIGIENKSAVTMNNGTITVSDTGIKSVSGATSIRVNNGTITADNIGINSASGSVVVTNGTVKGINSYGIYTYNTSSNNNAPVTVSNGSVISDNSIGISSNSNITVNGGTVSGTTGIKNISYWSGRSITINDGHIIGTLENGITGVEASSNWTIYIYGGTVEGNVSGINTKNTIQIGRNDGAISTTVPSIIGHTDYGLITTAYTSFYDGVLKGIEDGYSGLISIIPDGSLIKEDYEFINKKEYQTDYIVSKGNWLKVGNTEYNSINAAYQAIEGTEGTITVIADAYVDFAQTIPSGKKVYFDINGHSLVMTQPIRVTGNAEFINSEDDGGINNIRDMAIDNSGTLTITDGVFHSDTTYTVRNTGTLNLNGGVINSTKGYGINNSGTLVINGGEINSAANEAIYTTNKTTITGGTITANNKQAIYVYSGTLNVNGGTVKSNTNNAIYNYQYNSVTININGGEVIGKTNGIYTDYTNCRLNINGGHIVGETGAGVYTTTTTKVLGGVLEGNTYGLYTAGTNTTTALGENDGVIAIDSPVLKGETYGLYIREGTLNYYDGILEGITGRYSGIINAIADHAQIFDDEEVIDKKNYYTNYLIAETDIAINVQTNVKYGNLQEAINAAEDNQTIELLTNVPLYYELKVNGSSNITLDLNGKTISSNKRIINTVPFNITNSSEDTSLIKTSAAVNLITNNSTLNISNVSIKNNSSSNYVVYNTGTLTANNINIDSVNGIQSTNTATINNATIKATNTAVNNTGELSITNGSYTGSSYSLYSNSNRNVTASGLTLTGIFYNAGNNEVTFSNGFINSAIQNNTSKLSISETAINNSKISNSGELNISNSNYVVTVGSNYQSSPESAITTSNKMTIDKTTLLINKLSEGKYSIGINNSGELNIINNSVLNMGLENTSYEYKALQCTGNSNVYVDNSSINVLGGSNSYGVYVNGANANVVVNTGTIDVRKATNSYGVYINSGTFEIGHYEGTGSEDADVSTENPLIYVQGNSRGIGVKKVNGSFNFYDGIIKASKYAKPEIATNVEYQYEVTTYVDEDTGFEYALLEYMGNDYQGETVALLNGVYYKTVQEAIDKAEAGYQITLLKSVSENLVVPVGKTVNLNLNKHSITTTLINSGTINVYNGSLQNFDKNTVINHGTFIMGENDGTVSSSNIRIVSEVVAVVNDGTLIMYDGYLEGSSAIDGPINEVANFSRIRTEQDVQSEKKYLQSLSEDAIISGETDLIITIDPSSGTYDGDKGVKEFYIKHGESYTVLTPEKRGCDFVDWEFSDDSVVTGTGTEEDPYVITMNLTDITLTAVWRVSEDAVAHIDNEYFLTLQDAINFAEEGDLIELFKDVTESVTVPNGKKITIDLGGKTVTGAFINQGEVRLLNGEINNPDGIGLVNNKTLTLGENDGEIFIEAIKIIGSTVGLEQNGKFNFYDGYLEGDIALTGGSDSVPKGYFLYTETIAGNQRVYLIGNPENAVAITQEHGTQYFFSLQDAIDTASITGDEIFIARNFEASYPIEVKEEDNILINMSSYNITTGNTITNNGTLRIYDSSEEVGSITSAKPIVNNGTLTIDKIKIKQNTSDAAISNNSVLNLVGATIEASSGYAVNTTGPINMDANSKLTGTGGYALYNNYDGLTLNSGEINGIYNNKTLTIEDGLLINSIHTNAACVHSTTTGAKLTMNGGTCTAKNIGISLQGYKQTFDMNGGTITSDSHSIYIVNTGSTAAANANIVTINDGSITSKKYGVYLNGYTSKVILNDGTITSTGSTGLYANNYNSNYPYTVTLNGGKIKGADYGAYLYCTNLTSTGGEIETTSTNRDRYAVWKYYNNCNLTGITLTANNASGFYAYSGCTFNDSTINALAGNAYGIYQYYSNTINLNNTVVNTPGLSAIGIQMPTNNYTANVNMTGGRIYAGNVGIATGSNAATKNIKINSGEVIGLNYGISQTSTGATTIIGRNEDELSTEIPYVSGGLYGIYKTAGSTKFYNGRLRGHTYGYNNDFVDVRPAMDITEEFEYEDNYDEYTIMTKNSSADPISNYAKEGDGFIRITYIGETNETCTNNQVWDFAYTGAEQEFNAPCEGKYKLEAWGAQGGYGLCDNVSNCGHPGAGGYSTGEIDLYFDEKLYLNVGGQGGNGVKNACAKGGYNGGGRGTNDGGACGTSNDDDSAGGGGGATHIATFSGLLQALESNKETIIIVAGGGGGAAYNRAAGSGGGTRGGKYENHTTDEVPTQENGYAFGKGKDGSGVKQTSSCINGVNTSCEGVGGGGGGYYGGYSIDINAVSSGTGGSGYIFSDRLSNAIMYQLGVSWVNNYLVEREKYLKVGDELFNSFEGASEYILDNLDGTGTIELIKDKTIQESTTFTPDTNITFDLKGFTLTLTQPMTNNTNLTIVDSSLEKTGKIENSLTNNIINSKDLTLDGITVEAPNNYAVHSTEDVGTMTIRNTTINGSTGVYVNGNQTLLVENSDITAKNSGIYTNSLKNSITINSGNIKSTTGIAINDTYSNSTAANKTNIVINGGYIEGTTHGVYSNGNNLTINGGTITTKTSDTGQYALYLNALGGTVTINNDALITNPNTSAIYANNSITINNGTISGGRHGIVYPTGSSNTISLTMNDGTITAGLNGINFGSSTSGNFTVNINGGTISGGQIGINQQNTKVVTNIGNENEELSIENPLIIGENYAVYLQNGKANFYSGRLKGKIKSYIGDFNKLRRNYSVYTFEEVIDQEDPETTYKVSYLSETEAFLQVGDNLYNSFEAAIDEIDATGTIVVLNDKYVHEKVIIPAGKDITIDFEDKQVTMTQTIVNNGSLTITSDLANGKLAINNIKETAIENNGNLVIEDTNISSSSYGIYGNTNGGTINISNSKITGEYSVYLLKTQTMEVDDSRLYGNTYGIRMDESNTSIDLDNSYVHGGLYGIYTVGNNNEINASGSSINSSGGSAIYDNKTKTAATASTIIIDDCDINGSTNNIYMTYDNLTVTNSRINNYSSVNSNYAVYCNTGSVCNISDNTIINSINSSGIYTNVNMTLNDVEIKTSLSNEYGIYINAGNLELNNCKITTDGSSSYGIYAVQGSTTITLNESEIYSKNVGVYIGKTNAAAKTLNVNTGSVTGETYGIYQDLPNGIINIGKLDNAVSITDPYIEGGLISINKVSGNLNFYSGRLKGYNKGNPGTIDIVRENYEIFEDSDEIQSYLKDKRTVSNSDYSSEPIENTSKEGNGYAKITYETLGDNTIDDSSKIIDEVSSGNVLETYEFNFTGGYQVFDIVKSGKYKLEVWGAQGGYRSDSNNGGKGGYSSGSVDLTIGDTLYVFVGGAGNNGGYNGGGSRTIGHGGGGATDVRINDVSVLSRVIVAGGGGSDGASNKPGGYGGGSSGQSRSESYGSGGGGASQTAGGSYRGTFGFGGSGSTANNGYGGAGGGGWYGGGGVNPDGSGDDDRGGGGGSGYVYTASTATNYPSGCLLNSSYYLDETSLLAGNQTFTSPSGVNETGHLGNGYARITYYGTDETEENYVVHLNTSIGTIENPELIYNYGDSLGNIPSPVVDNENIEFIGWYLNSSYTKKVDENTVVKASFNLYARFRYTNAYCSSLINNEFLFDYTGAQETLNIECSGTYKLEVWGAEGGNASYNTISYIGGYGGYSKGLVDLEQGEKLYINVGGQGQSVQYTQSTNKATYSAVKGYNGGGFATYYSNNSAHAGGGGATHIATASGLLKNLSSNRNSILIVAGGGGGASAHKSSPSYSGTGGSGGGLTAGSGITANNTCYNYGTGGTQTAGGSYKACDVDGRTDRSSAPAAPSFGNGSNYTSNSTNVAYTGGGGGWYGGQSGYHAPGGGGSSYINNSRLYDKIMYGYEITPYYDSDITNIAYLVEITEFVQNLSTDEKYTSLQEAIDEVGNEETLQLIGNSNISEEITINDGKEFSIDFNGYSLTTSKQIVNNGNVTIFNNSENDSLLSNNIAITMIQNNKTLKITNVDLKGYNVVSVDSPGKLELYNLDVTGTNQTITNVGTMTIDNCNITGNTYAIYSNTARDETISNTTLKATTAYYKYALGNTTMSNMTLIGTLNNAKTGAVLEIDGGSITGTISNTGTTTLKNMTTTYTGNYSGTQDAIKNTGLMTIEDSDLTYINRTMTNGNYTYRHLYNTGTLTTKNNHYHSIYNYAMLNNFNSYRYNYMYSLVNSGIFTSIGDNIEVYGGSIGYGIHTNTTNNVTITNPTIKAHHSVTATGIYINTGSPTITGGNIETYTATDAYGIYANNGTVTSSGTTIYSHDATTKTVGVYVANGTFTMSDADITTSGTSSYGAYSNAGTFIIESGTIAATGTTAYGIYGTNGNIELGVYDGRGTDAADVSITDPHISGVGTTTGYGIRKGNGLFNFYDGYFTGSTGSRPTGDITSNTEKNYELKEYEDSETGYKYCILEFIK